MVIGFFRMKKQMQGSINGVKLFLTMEKSPALSGHSCLLATSGYVRSVIAMALHSINAEGTTAIIL